MARTGLDLRDHLHLPDQADWAEPFAMPVTVNECTIRLREARKAAEQIANQNFSQRVGERQQYIRESTSSPFQADKEHAQRLRFMQKAEDIKQLFRKLEAVQAMGQRQGVTRIEIPLLPGTIQKNAPSGSKLNSLRKLCINYNSVIGNILDKPKAPPSR
jgi:hypothetical protein